MLRHILYAFVCLSFAFNVWVNVATFNHSKETNQTCELVNQTFEVLRALDTAALAVYQYQTHQVDVTRVKHLILNAQRIITVPELAGEVKKLSALTEGNFSSDESNNALKIIDSLKTSEQDLLATRQDDYFKANDREIPRTVLSGLLDAILVIFFLLAFVYDRHRAHRMERSLSSSLEHVESTNEFLKKNLIQKDIDLKTTVHDLKNPLGSIRGFADLLEDEANSTSVLGMSQAIQRISNNTLALVSGLLSDVRSDAGPNENVAVLDCLKETCMFLEVTAAKKHQKIVISKHSKEFSLWGQAHQLQDVFYNLIGNAIKFSPVAKTIWIETKEENGLNSILIKDQGPGFQKDDFHKLFTFGSKLSAVPTGGEHSTGIGLCSAKQIIERFHGSIKIENNEGSGATVTVSFAARTSL